MALCKAIKKNYAYRNLFNVAGKIYFLENSNIKVERRLIINLLVYINYFSIH